MPRALRVFIYSVFLLTLCWQLDALNITIMEARNFVTAREMLVDGNYLIPTLNGEYRLAKPAFPTWLTAFSAQIFSIESIFGLRLPAVIFGFLGLIYACKLFRYFQPNKDDLLAGGMLLTSFYYFLSARSGMWDIFAQASMISGIYYYVRLLSDEKERVSSAIGFSVCFGCSIMSKGPVAPYALFLPFLVAFHATFRSIRWSRKRVYLLSGGAVGGLLLASLWPMYIAYSEAGQAAAAIVSKEAANWSSYNVKPFYYYWSFPTQSGIWTVVGFLCIFITARSMKRLKSVKPILFYFFWTLAVLFFLSIIPEKKSRYLLPILIPMAMLMSALIQAKDSQIRAVMKWALKITSIVLTIVGFAIALFPHEILALFPNRAIGGAIIVAIGGIATYFSFHRQLKTATWSIIGGMLAVILLYIGTFGKVMDGKEAVKSFHAFQSDPALKDMALYSLVDQRPELIWQIGRPTPILYDCELPPANDENIGVFSFYGINYELDSTAMGSWEVVSEEIFDQNPAFRIKKPNIALKRYFAVLKPK